MSVTVIPRAVEGAATVLEGAAAVARLRQLERGIVITNERVGILNRQAAAYRAGLGVPAGRGSGVFAAVSPTIAHAIGRRSYAQMFRGYTTASRRYADALTQQAQRLRAAEMDVAEIKNAQEGAEMAERVARETAEHLRNPTDEVINQYRPEPGIDFDPAIEVPPTREEIIDFIRQVALNNQANAAALRAEADALTAHASEAIARLRRIEDEVYQAHGTNLTLKDLEAKAIRAIEDAKIAENNLDRVNTDAAIFEHKALNEADEALQSLLITGSEGVALAREEANALISMARRDANYMDNQLEVSLLRSQRSTRAVTDYSYRSSTDFLNDVNEFNDKIKLAQAEIAQANAELAAMTAGSAEYAIVTKNIRELGIDINSYEKVVKASSSAAEESAILEKAARHDNLGMDQIRSGAVSSAEAAIRIELIAKGQTDLAAINVAARQAAEARVALCEARVEATLASERVQQARAATKGPNATIAEDRAAEVAEEQALQAAQAVERAKTAYSEKVTTIQIGEVTLATLIAVPSTVGVAAFYAKEAKAEMRQASIEARRANENVVEARAAAAQPGAGLDKLVAVGMAELKAGLAAYRVEEKETVYAQAEATLTNVEKAVAEAEAEAQAELAAETYTASTAEGMAWEAMKTVGSAGLHYTEELIAYGVDVYGYTFMGLPNPLTTDHSVDLGHGALAAQNGIIAHVAVPVVGAALEGGVDAANITGEQPINLEKIGERKYASDVAKNKDQIELDKEASRESQARMAEAYEINEGIVIPDAKPSNDSLEPNWSEDPGMAEVWKKAAGAKQSTDINICEPVSPSEEIMSTVATL